MMIFKSQEIWVCAGTQRKRRYIPIQEIHGELEPNVRSNLLAFHAVTRLWYYESVWWTWETYSIENVYCAPRTSRWIGQNWPEWRSEESVEWFVIKLYGPTTDVVSVGPLRAWLFRSKQPDALPPTQDALRQHIARSSYQTKIWHNFLTPAPALPSVLHCVWTYVLDYESIQPVLLTQEAIPKPCHELIVCVCKRNCSRTTLCMRLLCE